LITSLRMNNTYVSTGSRFNAGSLVGYNNGTIRDVFSQNVSSYAPRQAGGLVGWNNAGLIESSATSGGHDDATFYAGGLVAYMTGGTVRNSYSNVSAGSNLEVGGLIGAMDDGTVENSYAYGSLSGNFGNVYGPAGVTSYAVNSASVSNSFFSTAITS